MFRFRILAVMLLATFVVAVAGSQAASQKLKGALAGNVGPGFTITLTQRGKTVTKLKAGSYKITVKDQSSMHNFHLFGPKLNKLTSVPFVGKKVWTVKLVKGKYTYQCDVHFASGMIGHFKVT